MYINFQSGQISLVFTAQLSLQQCSPQPVAFQHAGSCSCAAAREPQVAEWCSIAIHIIYALTYVLYRPHTVILYDEHYSG